MEWRLSDAPVTPEKCALLNYIVKGEQGQQSVPEE